jgi:flavin reductase (DIM6/NTAB) family NADH-FMN oxidoreductase RutF
MIRFFGWLQVLFVHFLANNAARRSTLSYRVKKEYQPFREKIEVLPGAYTIANTKDNKPFNAAAVNFGSLASAEEYMIGIISKDPSMADSIHVIPNNEINASI